LDEKAEPVRIAEAPQTSSESHEALNLVPGEGGIQESIEVISRELADHLIEPEDASIDAIQDEDLDQNAAPVEIIETVTTLPESYEILDVVPDEQGIERNIEWISTPSDDRSAQPEDIRARYIQRDDLDQKAEPIHITEAQSDSSESSASVPVLPADGRTQDVTEIVSPPLENRSAVPFTHGATASEASEVLPAAVSEGDTSSQTLEIIQLKPMTLVLAISKEKIQIKRQNQSRGLAFRLFLPNQSTFL
jgi:hypothetical protein